MSAESSGLLPDPPRTLVVGLGRTGLACARWLHRQGGRVAVTDSREDPPGLAVLREALPDVALFLGSFSAEAFRYAQRVVVSPGVSLSEPLIQESLDRGVPVLGDIDLFADEARAPVVAITGSNGKSTVTTLVGVIAHQAGVEAGVGGNLGTPVLELLEAPGRELYVLELSSFQLETCERLRPRAAVVLNLSEDHMDRYAGLEDYAAAKARIYRHSEVAVVNRDDPRVVSMAPRATLGFTLGEPVAGDYGLRQQDGQAWLARGEERLLPADRLRMAGRHNLANALAALALCEAIDLPRDVALRVLQRFPGLPHRTEWLGEAAGVDWYNDSKATNPGATLAAVEGLGRPLVLIAGGQGKGADFSVLREPLARHARAVVLMGEDAPLLRAALEGAVPLLEARDLAEAVALAGEQAQPGDAVLLSPACASFDQFNGFEDRGERFRQQVRERLGGGGA